MRCLKNELSVWEVASFLITLQNDFTCHEMVLNNRNEINIQTGNVKVHCQNRKIRSTVTQNNSEQTMNYSYTLASMNPQNSVEQKKPTCKRPYML